MLFGAPKNGNRVKTLGLLRMKGWDGRGRIRSRLDIVKTRDEQEYNKIFNYHLFQLTLHLVPLTQSAAMMRLPPSSTVM
jgi:hypothetical protein